MEWKVYFADHQREVFSSHKTKAEALEPADKRLRDGYAVRIEGPNGELVDEEYIKGWRERRA